MIKGSADQKQHLNLSEHAYEIICQDMFTLMHTESLSGFLNAVFQRYYEFAEASISLCCQRIRQGYLQELEPALGREMASQAADILTKKEEQTLCCKAQSYSCGHLLKFRLNNENFEYLYPVIQEDENTFHFPEDKYYRNAGQYIKAVIEEYASKSYFEREEIFCRDTILLLNNCIETGTLLRLGFVNGTYEMKPYCLNGDDKREYHYLVGISWPLHGDPSQGAITSVRLSQIITAEGKNYRSGRLTSAQRKAIQKRIRSNGIQFLRDQEEEEIVVRLTSDGIRKYRKMLHLRPSLVKKEDYEEYSIYHFKCTQLQARFYLFRLGADAYVLQPVELREALLERFEQAAEAYRKG